jgi:hypothetical protein
VIEHIYALVMPPYGLHGPFFFHLTFVVRYAWLGIAVWTGAGCCAAIVLTVLLVTQLVGRIFIWRAGRPQLRRTLKTLLAMGAVITLVVLACSGSQTRPAHTCSTNKCTVARAKQLSVRQQAVIRLSIVVRRPLISDTRRLRIGSPQIL